MKATQIGATVAEPSKQTIVLTPGNVQVFKAGLEYLCELRPVLEELERRLDEEAIRALDEKLNTVGDDAQLANLDLQNILQKQQQTLQMMSNISKMLYDTAMSVIRKAGG
ncbi:MAG TPA: hypothetical protein VHI95_02925 [Acidimicrobiales bacterium]|nr:hypothetical protein [Acidimicrobiales bacterium]